MTNLKDATGFRQTKTRFREYTGVFVFFLFFWFLLFIISGSLFSEYHLADDHEVLRMSRDLAQEGGVLVQAKKWIDVDFSVAHRFKPFYYLHRVLEARIFGPHFFLWLTYTGFLGVLTSFLLYLFGRTLGFSLTESLLLPLLALAGKQGVVWWSLGPQETIGMTMLAAALMCMVYMVCAKRKRSLWASFFVMFAVLMSLSKESFIVFLPALAFWLLCLEREKGGRRWKEIFKRDAAPLSVLGFIFLAETLFIYRYVGVGGYSSGAGGLEGFAPLSYLKMALMMTLSVSAVGYGLIFIVGVFLLLLTPRAESETVFARGARFLSDFRSPLILFLLMVGPQCILYARSGFYGRYLLPLLFGYAVLLVYFLNYLKCREERFFLSLPARETGAGRMMSMGSLFAGLFMLSAGAFLLLRRDWSMNIFAMLGRPTRAFADFLKPALFLFLAGGMFILLYGTLRKKAVRPLSLYRLIFFLAVASLALKAVNFIQLRDFVREGRQLTVIRSLVHEHTLPQDALLVVRDPVYPENSYSLKVMLNMLADRPRVFVFGDIGIFAQNGDHGLNRWYDGHFMNNHFSELTDKNSVRFVIVMGGPARGSQDQDFRARIEPYLGMDSFQRADIDPFVVYYLPRTQEKHGEGRHSGHGETPHGGNIE